MHELQRLTYLDLLGIDSYVSRAQLPGAAPTQRLALVRAAPKQAERATAAGSARSIANLDVDLTRPSRQTPAAKPPAAAPDGGLVRFSLSAIVAGRCLWLESLGDMPLASEQVALVRGMAHALAMARGEGALDDESVQIGRFDWPMHQNHQLDHSADAATAGLSAFLLRRVEQHACSALVILGEDSARWLDTGAYKVPVVQTLATAQMLSDPACKAQVWADLSTLCVAG